MIKVASCLFLLIFCVSVAYSMDMPTTVGILTKYGYLPKDSDPETMDMEQLSEALTKFQRVANMPMTGKMDEDTEEMMLKPRCGMSDANIKFASYNIRGQWQKRNLTYRVFQYSEKLKREDVDRLLARAFATWMRHSPLVFNKALSGNVDIEIRFNNGQGSNPFDGPGGTLAYAYFPQYGGDMWFDESERWSSEPGQGLTSFYHVAVHEIGHALGLDHSEIRSAIMYPYYWTGYQNLLRDDINGIQKIYGRRLAGRRRVGHRGSGGR